MGAPSESYMLRAAREMGYTPYQMGMRGRMMFGRYGFKDQQGRSGLGTWGEVRNRAREIQASDAEAAARAASTPAAAPAPPSDIMEREGDSGSSGDAQQRKKRRGGGKSSLLIPSASSTGLNL